MDMLGFISSALPAMLGAIGAWFLVNEVNHAHQFEDLSRELNEIAQLQTLFRTSPREFWLRSAMISFQCDRSTAEGFASKLSDAEINVGIADYQAFWQQQVSASLDRWNSRTIRHQLSKRRRLLWTGFWLLMASAGVQVLLALLKLLSS